jgi:ubiquinone/menaquinone biosynthesis C-methylase UbiE
MERLKAPRSTETFLDVGCCLGHVVRQLIAEGVSSERLYGTDLQPRFLDLGYELFRDRDRIKNRATFVAGDMLQENDVRLEKLTGKVDIIYASAFFHLFEREDQIKAAKRMVRFLRPENPRAMIFGRNEGPKIVGWEKYVLDAESWQRMWDEVGEATRTCWRTEMDVESSNEWIKVRFGVYRVI